MPPKCNSKISTSQVILDPKTLPRISSELTVAQLKDECRARSIKLGSNKTDLLVSLQIGSIRLSAIPEFNFIDAVRKLMVEEKQKLSEETQKYVEQHAALEDEKYEKKVKMREEEKILQRSLHTHRCEEHACLVAETAALRFGGKARIQNCTCSRCGSAEGCIYSCEQCNWDICKSCLVKLNEFSSQQSKHIHKSTLHRCLLAETADLLTNGIQRSITAQCDCCHQLPTQQACKFTCMKCDWDICASCIAQHEQQKLRAAKRQEEIVVNKSKHSISVNYHDCLLAKTSDLLVHGKPKTGSCSWPKCHSSECKWTCESCNFNICASCASIAIKLNKKRKFGEDVIEEKEEVYSPVIINPPAANLDPHKLKTFVVWKSCGYAPDGWHSYGGEPDKEFDSSYDTILQANTRVRYVFYHKNVWGLSKQELCTSNVNETVEKTTGGLTLVVHPDDSEVFTVAAVKREVFEYLASNKQDDEDEDEEVYEGPYASF